MIPSAYVDASEQREERLIDPEILQSWRERVKNCNINQQTLLATDYLNHFNEIIMLIGMIPDMPELVEDCLQWEPKSYPNHFRESSFSHRELAVAAYDFVPDDFLLPFEDTVRITNDVVLQAVRRLEEATHLGDPEILKLRSHAAARNLQRLIDVLNAIIHGSTRVMDQGEIDQLMVF